MKTEEKQNIQRNRATGMRISVAIHLALLVLALVPLISAGTASKKDEAMIIPVDFRAAEGHPEKSLQAKAMQESSEVRPVAKEKEDRQLPVASEETEVVPEPTDSQVLEAEIVSENAEEIPASPVDENMRKSEEIAGSGGAAEAPVEGAPQGGDTAGNDAWKAGLEGDGILTRRIVHREDITQVAEQDGVIAINVCVNRGGKVSAAKYNEDHTTIQDKELIRKALYVVTGYRFETDMAAPEKECGMLTFIFDVDVDRENPYVTID